MSGGTKIGPHGFGVTYYHNWSERIVDLENEISSLETSREQLRLFTSFALGSRLTFSSQVSLNLDADTSAGEQDLLNQRYVLDWQAACYRWTLEFRETNYRNIQDRDVVFLLNLKNIGTFLDVNDSF